MPIILDGTNGLDSPDLNITGTGARITGLFDGLPQSNRVAFQTITTNTQTTPIIIPNGTVGSGATASGLILHDSTSVVTGNGSTGSIANIQSSEIRLSAGIQGTGTYLPIVIHTGGSESLRLSATSKAVILAGGNTSANGTGITFPATQSASSDANTLDDYEEGSWTPVIVPGVGTVTSQTCTGRYTKVGNMVTVTFTAVANSGTISTISTITGLPFTAAANSLGGAREYVATGNFWQLSVSANTSSISPLRYDNVTNFGSGWGIFGTVTYFV
jgi:hypothetical protein